jgi:predicted RNA-binding protein with TRAM domain
MSEGATSTDDGRSSQQGYRFPKVYFKPKPVKIGDDLDVTIAEVSKRGDGVTRVDGYVIFVPNAKQGDAVKIRITEIRPNFAIGTVVPSPTAPS